jgi:3-hydroxyisobutyrate dehydrogenase-like beta-hydroxyacid dehydrogenase
MEYHASVVGKRSGAREVSVHPASRTKRLNGRGLASMQIKNICLIGFGEVGGIFARDFANMHLHITTFDVLARNSSSRETLQSKALAAGAVLYSTLDEALLGADLVVSAVTATSARDVARDAGRLLKSGQVFLDLNSISPRAKQDNAREIEQAGASYVEAAVMAPVPPQRIRVPMLLGGAKASEMSDTLNAFGMNTKVVDERIGVASAIKMCRSVMIKGLEALTVECLFAARRYGAEDAVLASLHASFPSLGWSEHGRRRAAEMREVASTLVEAGIDPLMATATAVRQDSLVDEMQTHNVSYDSSSKFSWREMADRLKK